MSPKRAELLVVTCPLTGHLVSTVKTAQLLVDRDDRLSVTILTINNGFDSNLADTISSFAASLAGRCIRFITLPHDDPNPSATPTSVLPTLRDRDKPRVRDAVAELVAGFDADSARLAGFVLDIFNTGLIDVANEFGVPSYIYQTSSASVLRLTMHLTSLNDDYGKDLCDFKDADTELVVPGFLTPVPTRVLPSPMMNKDVLPILLDINRRLKETKGIIVNTFRELESPALDSLSTLADHFPPVYAVGPILKLDDGDDEKQKEENPRTTKIIQWLDGQPSSSVVFLCFGSMGSFGAEQVKEIARGLERSGQRFLWSLRRPPPKDKFQAPSEYAHLEEALPEGFLKRTAEIGMVIGWAPQVAILSHPAVGGFVSHCGWNSTLESIWCGVPIATWPMFAEQQLNAFKLVRELGIAVEITMDYRKRTETEHGNFVVSGDDVEKGVKSLMEQDSKVRAKMKAMKEKSRKALIESGSSYIGLGSFIEDIIKNTA